MFCPYRSLGLNLYKLVICRLEKRGIMPETDAIKAGKKILICDDEKTVVDFLALFLKKEGFPDVDISH